MFQFNTRGISTICPMPMVKINKSGRNTYRVTGILEYVELRMIQKTNILWDDYRAAKDYQRVTPKCLRTATQNKVTEDKWNKLLT